MKGSTVLCKDHSTKICELHCEKCNNPICALCVSSDKHVKHKKVEIWKKIENKKEELRKNLQELEHSILPKHEAFAFDNSDQKANIEKNSRKLKSDIDKHGEEWHKQINTIINKYKSDINEMDATYNAALNKQSDGISYRISEIKNNILYQKRLLDSFNFYSVSGYKSKNSKFRSLSSQPKSFFPSFTPYQINTNFIQQQFGLVAMLPIVNNEESDETSTPIRPFIDEIQIVTDLRTELWTKNKLNMVCCLADKQIWTCGEENLIRLNNLKGELAFEIPTNSGNSPKGIAMAMDNGNRLLAYIDCSDRTINITNNDTYIHETIRPSGWHPISICDTSLGAFFCYP